MRYAARMLMVVLGVLLMSQQAVAVGGGVARWHVDPLSIEPVRASKRYLLLPDDAGSADRDGSAPVFDVPAERLSSELDDIALAGPLTRRIAGGPDILFSTYEQKSTLFRFPDYISIRALPLGEDRSMLAIYSRSRYGYYDFGVNRTRIDGWLEELRKRLAKER